MSFPPMYSPAPRSSKITSCMQNSIAFVACCGVVRAAIEGRVVVVVVRDAGELGQGGESDTVPLFLIIVLAHLFQRYPLLAPLAHLTLHPVPLSNFLVVIAV